MKINIILMVAVVATAIGCNRTPVPNDFDVWGIDISKHQSKVDWEKVVKRNKPDFVFLKATEGSIIVDPSYARHSRDLEKHGILKGAYHFFGHRTSGKEQAENFIKVAKLKKGDLIPVLDIEPHRFMTDPKKMVAQAKAFCGEIRKEYGVNPIIYCSTNFYEHYLKNDFKPNNYILWIADYRGENPSHLKWHIWQHTESHKLHGIEGKVDRNVFVGDSSKLKKIIL